jgi:hypothetical protein
VLYPRWPEADVALDAVTNGVHVPSWDSADADALWTAACGADVWRGTMGEVGTRIQKLSDAELWSFRSAARGRLIPFVRESLARQLAASGIAGQPLESAAHVLDADALTIGLARRFTAYKRPTLLLGDPERLARLLRDTRRRVQIVVAGKAHPRDEEGKGFVSDWVRFVRRADVRASAVFLADYDLRVAEHLVQGVDLWLNTPLSAGCRRVRGAPRRRRQGSGRRRGLGARDAAPLALAALRRRQRPAFLCATQRSASRSLTRPTTWPSSSTTGSARRRSLDIRKTASASVADSRIGTAARTSSCVLAIDST